MNGQILAELIALLSRAETLPEISRTRYQFLKLVAKAVCSRSCSVFLWLYDPGSRTLDLANYYNGSRKHTDPAQLARLYVKPHLTRTLRGDSSALHISLTEQPRLAGWCALEQPYETLIPLIDSLERPASRRLVGALQIVSENNVASSVSLPQEFLDAVVAKIKRSRDQRRLWALTHLQSSLLDIQSQLDKPNQIPALYAAAAATLAEVTSAEICVVYGQQRDLGLRAVAASDPGFLKERHVATPHSITYKVLRQINPIRLTDFSNPKERRRFFRTTYYDQEQNLRFLQFLPSASRGAWLCCPVVVGGHGTAVIKLVNKKGYLARKFSYSDEITCKEVSRFLASVLPSVATHEAMVLISSTVLGGRIQDHVKSSELFEKLAELLPGAFYLGLVVQKTLYSPAVVFPLGGSEAIDLASKDTLGCLRDGELTPLVHLDPGGEWSEDHHLYSHRLDGVNAHIAKLVVGLRRAYLTDYERHVVSFLSKELAHLLRSEADIEKALDDLVQIRHNVRAGLAGVVGYVAEALGCFEIYRKLAYQPRILAQARFRKALERANLFSQKTRILLEESRFLLASIEPDSLRVGSHSVSVLVREVVTCLRPAAEQRRVELLLNNRLSKAVDNAEYDSQLVFILLFNVVENAIKYSHRHQVVSIDLSSAPGLWILHVKDRGVFIHPRDRKAIFQPFVRRPTGDAATTRPGTGLGLALVSEIVEAHGGHITFSSTSIAGDGTEPADTVFRIKMPRRLERG